MNISGATLVGNNGLRRKIWLAAVLKDKMHKGAVLVIVMIIIIMIIIRIGKV